MPVTINKLAVETVEMCLEHLTIFQLVKLLPVSRPFRTAAGKLIRHRVNRALQNWTGDADGFKALLRRHNAVVTGPWLLRVLHDESIHPYEVQPDCFQVFVPNGQRGQFVQEMLATMPLMVRDDEGPHHMGSPLGCGQPAEVFERWCLGGGPEPEFPIFVMESSNTAAVYPIIHFDNTLLMNYLSADHICIAYPRLTARKQGCVHPQFGFRFHPYLPSQISWRTQGYTLMYPLQFSTIPVPGGRKSTYTCASQRRTFYDGLSLVIPLCNGSSHVDIPQDTCSWILGGLLCGPRCHSCRITPNQGGQVHLQEPGVGFPSRYQFVRQ